MQRGFHPAWPVLPVLLLAACGQAAGAPEDAAFLVRDTAVVVRTDAAFTRSADFPARVESTVETALQYWGGGWQHLRGTTIVFEGAARVDCPGLGPSLGCWDGDIRLTTQDAGEQVRCVEATVLVHEVGHAVIGDAGHEDPRWMDFERVAERLAGRAGYSESGVTACVPVPSVWRHPGRR